MSTMQASPAVSGKKGKKRKSRDGDEAHASPAKRSKTAARSQRRQDRLDAAAATSTPTKSIGRLREAGDTPGSKKAIRRAERKEQRKAAASGLHEEVEVEDESEPEAEAEVEDETVLPEDAVDYDPEEARRQARKERKLAKKLAAHLGQPKPSKASKAVKKQEKQDTPSTMQPARKWMVSEPAAGRLIDRDPLFVRDANGEEFIIAAVARELQVLSLETSLIVRTLPAHEGLTIAGFAIETPGSNLVQVSYSSGRIGVWDWTNNFLAGFQSPLIESMIDFAAVHMEDGEREGISMPYIARLDRDDSYIIRTNRGNGYSTEHALESIQVLGQADYILACGPKVYVIGARKADDNDQYTWIEFPLTKPASCMHARMVESSSGTTSRKASKRHPQLQLALGVEDGQIHLYDDLSSLFLQNQPALPTPHILHWHRSAVSAVKFSPDGNYLISGGKETVLVLWQLETGRKQHLPHLTSEIERISVNTSGDRYALQMGDNSIMVLSTAELKPVANFAGLQMGSASAQPSRVQAAALHPKDSKKLLLTVPPTQPESSLDAAPRPFLQTFDTRTARHVTRQALTRNNATDLNMGPEDNAILPPDVAHLAISQDGEWLATVDEWLPPITDVVHLASSASDNEEARRSRREVHLKIWHWDASQEMWTLSTRADAPHQRAESKGMGAGRVLALIADPVSNGFATVGEDNCVKIWKPRTRMRGGVAMMDAQDVELTEWACKRSVQLSSTKGRADSPLDTSDQPGATGAAAAYSTDGSLLALSSSTPTTLDESVPAVTFIDTATGTIKSISTSLSDGTVMTAIAFLERHFIAVTHKAAFVWDLVNDSLMQKIKLAHSVGTEPLLAVNEADQQFAIASAAEREGKASRVEVWSTRDTTRLFKQDFEVGIVKILSGKGARGFTVLFEDATLRTILPAGGATRLKTRDAPAAVEQTAMEVDEPVVAGLLTSSAGARSDAAFEIDEDDRPVVRPEQLASIFDVGQSFAMPPVKDMFQDVVRLFGRKPQRAAAVV